MPERHTEPKFLVDGHLDLAYLGVSGRRFDVPVAPGDDACVSWPDLAEGPVRIALGTIFTETRSPESPCGYRDSEDVETAHRAGVAQLTWYEREAESGRIRLVHSRRDLEAVVGDDSPSPAPGVVLLMEGADPIRTPSEAAWWHARGVRVVGLSWAYGSRYSGGNAEPGPLTAMGRDLVATLDALGILHDASHLCDESFYDLLSLSDRRVVATHSNCRELVDPRQRHLTDDQIRVIGERDGLVGLNLYGKFLAVDRPATLNDCVRTVHHVAELIGPTCVGLGSDLDGGFPASGLPEGVRHPRAYRSLAEAIGIAGFAADNWLRVLRASLPDS